MNLAIIIPTFNEEKNIKRVIEKTEDFILPPFQGKGQSSAKQVFISKNLKNKKVDIIISDANSQDKTQEIVRQMMRKYNNLKLKIINFQGKGYQLTKTIKEENYEFFIYMDCDLATPLKFLLSIIEFLEKGHDIVIGSRFLKESKTKRTLKRKLFGDGYRFLVKILFSSPIKDFQCGFKGFKKESVLPILKKVQDKKWIWDTEVILRAQKKNLKIKEIPIQWEEKRESKVNIIKDPIFMGYGILKLFLRLKIKN